MITYATDENFKEMTAEGVVLVDFFGKTCGPCKMVARSLEQLDDEMPFLTIVKVDVDECPKLSEEFRIEGIPDLYYYKDGVIRQRDLGAVGMETIRQKVAELLYE